ESQFYRDYQTMDGLGTARLSLLANGAPDVIPADAPTMGALSYLRAALPTSWLGAADDFAKYVNYRAELRGLAYREGVGQGLDGDDLATHVAQRMDDVPPAMHQQALSGALANTFQEPLTGLGATIQQLADGMNVPIAHTGFELPVGRILLPFIKVPTNI